jgi:hypothetical protein
VLVVVGFTDHQLILHPERFLHLADFRVSLHAGVYQFLQLIIFVAFLFAPDQLPTTLLTLKPEIQILKN